MTAPRKSCLGVFRDQPGLEARDVDHLESREDGLERTGKEFPGRLDVVETARVDGQYSTVGKRLEDIGDPGADGHLPSLRVATCPALHPALGKDDDESPAVDPVEDVFPG